MYLEIDEGFITHRKTLRFCGMMQDQNAFAYLLRLWSWATRSAPDGRLSGMDPTDIEIAVQYRLMDGKCYRAMVAAGFVDTDSDGNPTEIHNWLKRTGGSIARMDDNAKRKKIIRLHKDNKCAGAGECAVCDGKIRLRAGDGHANVPGQSKDTSETVPGESPEFLGQTDTDQSRPVQTSPDPEGDLPPAHACDPPFVVTEPEDPKHPTTAYGVLQMYGRMWTERYREPWIRDQWDPKACDAFLEAIRGLSPPDRDATLAAIPGAIARYLASDVEFYRARKHPFQVFARDFNKLRNASKKEPQMIGKQKIADLPIA